MMAAERKNSIYLENLLRYLQIERTVTDVPVAGLATDSRKLKPGELFIAREAAIPFINDAIRAGASAVLVDETAVPDSFICPVPLVRIPGLDHKIGPIASWLFNNPSDSIKLIAVTGTNGKTSVSYLLANALASAGERCGLIGTLGHGPVDDLSPGMHTTPEALHLQEILSDMRAKDIRQLVMEVSSHGIDQYRIAGLEFEIAIFTNLSRDHLDYHGSFENYAAAKRRLFTEYSLKNAVINIDDSFGRDLLEHLPENIHEIAFTMDSETCRLFGGERVVLGNIETLSADKMQIRISSPWGEASLETGLIGQYNAENFLACFCALCLSGFSPGKAADVLSSTRGIPGRLECYREKGKPMAVIDYAHTPHALEQVLKTLRQVCEDRLICVFGCGGNRDRGKRKVMGRIAGQYADHVIITNDNPRDEDPDRIARQIMAGIVDSGRASIKLDRAEAIKKAMASAGPKDIVLVAGKGHETCQEVAGIRHPFSDHEVVKNLLAGNR